MRKQYHFWPGTLGLDAWDVDRLIALSEGLPVLDVSVHSLSDVDSNYWFAEGFGPLTVRAVAEHMRLVRDVDPAFPIILGANGRVMDGMHRVARALLEGRDTISAVRFSSDPAPDYRNCRPGDLDYSES